MHRWFGDGYVALGFKSGAVVVVSSRPNEIGREVHSTKAAASPVYAIMANHSLGKLAVLCGTMVQTFSATSYAEISADRAVMPSGHSGRAMSWSTDGKVRRLCSASGRLPCMLPRSFLWLQLGFCNEYVLSASHISVHMKRKGPLLLLAR